MIPPKSFDLNLMRIFAHIYISRNLTRTAEKLNVSQPAVSRSLSKLNDIFGERLFIRNHHEMLPSRLAEHIADHIFNSLAEAEKAMLFNSDSIANESSLEIKLGMNDYCVNVLFSHLYNNFKHTGDNISLNTIHCTYANVLDKIENMEIDGAIVSEAPKSNRIDSTPLFTEDYVVICHSTRTIDTDVFPIDLFLKLKHTLVSYEGSNKGWVDDKLLEMGYTREVACTTHLFSLIPQLVVELDVIATIPRRIAHNLANHFAINIYELPIENKTHHFHFVRPRYANNAFYSELILRTVQDAVNDL